MAGKPHVNSPIAQFRLAMALLGALREPISTKELAARFQVGDRQVRRHLTLVRHLGFDLQETVGYRAKKQFHVAKLAETLSELLDSSYNPADYEPLQPKRPRRQAQAAPKARSRGARAKA